MMSRAVFRLRSLMLSDAVVRAGERQANGDGELIESAPAMAKLKDGCSLRPVCPQVRLPFLAWLLGPMLVACHPPDKEFRIEFPDVSFVVERDWVPPNVRAQAVASFEVNIPYSRVPKETVELALAVQRSEYGFELDQRTYRIQLEYKPTPQPGELFEKLQKRPGWKLLPEGTDPNYRVGVEDDPRSASAGPTTWYELKSDPRYVIMCGSIWDGRGNGKTIDSCSVSVPYREFAGTHCTQLEFGFRKKEMGRWAEIAQRDRDVIRQFEFNSTQTKKISKGSSHGSFQAPSRHRRPSRRRSTKKRFDCSAAVTDAPQRMRFCFSKRRTWRSSSRPKCPLRVARSSAGLPGPSMG